MGRLVVVGSLNMDLVVRVPRLPAPGETILGGQPRHVGGGKGANQALTCARLGAEVTMLGSVGRDENGERLLAGLQAAGVDVSAVQRLAGETTGLAIIAVDDRGANNIIVSPGANLATSPEYVDLQRRRFAEADAVLAQLEIPLETVTRAAGLAKSLGKLMVLDPAPAAPLPDALYALVDLIKPNEIELAHLTGLPTRTLAEAETAARRLLARGAGRVLATLGAQGALLVEPAGTLHVPARQDVQVRDTTAAGDSFTAAAVRLLLDGHSLAEAARFAVAVAGVVVSRPGAQSSIPDAAEVAALMPPRPA
ncbi:MAG: ribokinase [Deltaproteobacteria bacterium]|jgi:ribokinase|nr:ribokinase [Deltaproteobacteria bacterium]